MDILEISSDSDSEAFPSSSSASRLFNDSDSNIIDIVNKYISSTTDNASTSKNLEDNYSKKYTFIEDDIPMQDIKSNEKHTFLDNDVIFNSKQTLQALSEKYKLINVNKSSEPKTLCCLSDAADEAFPELSKLTEKEQKQIEKQQKTKERERKKEEAQREKALKQAFNAANKNLKPEECIKFICVHLDNEIINSEYRTDILPTLQNSNVKYKVESQIFPNSITWTRKIQSHLMDDDGKFILSENEQETDELLLIMNYKSFIETVTKDNNGLTREIQSMKSILPNKKISLAIVGLQNYFKYHKNQKKNEIRNDFNSKSTKTDKLFADLPKISWRDTETALTELQLLCSCSHRLVETSIDLSEMVFQFSKAIAQLPYKQQKAEKYQQSDWYAAGDNKDCVKVDKDGNGLTRLWNQALTTFPLARLETAEAISSKYPSVNDLMQAYSNCTHAQQAEKLLQDIPIRRAGTTAVGGRKIGAELSKKIFHFFTSLDGDLLI